MSFIGDLNIAALFIAVIMAKIFYDHNIACEELPQNSSELLVEQQTKTSENQILRVDSPMQTTESRREQDHKDNKEGMDNDREEDKDWEEKERTHYREDWDSIRTITDDAFKKLLLQYIDPTNELDRDVDCAVIDRAEGSFHLCAMIDVFDRGSFIIKVPATGTAALWQEGDAWNMRSQVGTMKYIRQYAWEVPVPQVFGWDDTLDNTISAPYIVMEAMKGKSARHLWMDLDADGVTRMQDFNFPSDELEKKRQHFLTSLANTMAQLQYERFDKIGVLNFDVHPTEGEVLHRYSELDDGTLVQIPAFSTTAELLDYKMPNPESADSFTRGLYTLYSTIFHSAPFAPASSHNGEEKEEEEEFVLTHVDLDLQNIFVDEDGNVTGIIDWDGCRTMPRCLGPTALPVFLREDYEEDYGMQNARHMPWALNYYRKSYAKYMLRATSRISNGVAIRGDGKFTAKSALYYAAYEAIWLKKEYEVAFIDRVFKELPSLKAFSMIEFLNYLGGEYGLRAAQILETEIPEFFKP